MQWKPARNAKFAIDEGKIGLKKLKSKVTGGLDGRQPGVETGTFSLYLCSGSAIISSSSLKFERDSHTEVSHSEIGFDIFLALSILSDARNLSKWIRG